MKVFIGGSRRVSRLDKQVKGRLDEIVRKRLPIIIGDANGADKAVQDYLRQSAYDQVEVFCTEGHCRNNLGNWKIRAVPAVSGRKRNRDYYAAKDRLMADEGSIGFMVWDGKSKGTLDNVLRLMQQGKKAVVYFTPSRQFTTLRSMGDLERLSSRTHLGISRQEPHVGPSGQRIKEYSFF